MDTEIAKGIGTLALQRAGRTAGICRVIRPAEVVHSQQIATVPCGHVTESGSHRGLKQDRVIYRQHESLLLRLGDHEVALLHRLGERLLDEHMAPHLKRLERES